MTKKTTYTKITAKIIFITLFFTLLISYTYAEYMKRDAISTLAHIDAKKTSMLVFEVLYSAMQRGWTKDDLNEIITRLNNVDENLEIKVYRSQIVAELFGEVEEDKIARESFPAIKKAMRGEESLNISNLEHIEYYYPVKATLDCLKCHTNAKVGDTLGTIDISYPVDELKISLNDMINFFIGFMTVFSIIIFLAIFIELEKYLIKPIKNFSNTITKITNSKDIKTRIMLDEEIEEIDSIKNVFNSMLDSIEHQFYNDSLTGLKNRRRLMEALENKEYSFLMIVNIDSFQEINDLYGNDCGDELLKEFANFLDKMTPKEGSLYRLHSDEFAYLCQKGTDLDEFTLFASRLSEKISKENFEIDSKSELNLSVTIGISHGVSMLLVNADTALVVAKKERKNFLVFDESMTMTKEYEKNFIWTKRLKKAIQDDKIVPVFQPIVDTKTKKVVKYEALMRIKDNDGTYIAPIHFLELAKKNKIYHLLTKIMIDKTFDKFKNSPYLVSINVSVEDILDEDTYSYIIEKLKSSSMGGKIVFEIIESEGIENFEEVLKFINEVKKYGVKISIDDFGTGYSNFEYLMKLKVDYIKIDGSMIKNLDVSRDSQMITQTIVEFAKKMNIQTVAEFVYSKNISEAVEKIGVDFSQGYYFGEPKEELK